MPSSGLLILDKPYGMASFKTLQFLKRRFRWRKLGHVGTLDPLATGVLPICIGKATKLIPYIVECHKRYEALIRLGVETQTQDREAGITRIYMGRRYPSLDRIEQALEGFRGEIEQIPPMYSAIKYRGRRLYEWARDGEEMPREPRKIKIYKLTCLAYNYPFLLIDVTCGRGTYIRTLASDIGRALGTWGHLWALRRLGVGDYTIKDALQWEHVISMDHEKIEKSIVPLGEILSFLPAVKIDYKKKEAMTQGQIFMLTDLHGDFSLDGVSVLRIQDPDGEFLGLGGIVARNEVGSGFEICIRPSLVVV